MSSLRIDGLHVAYGKIQALRGVSLLVQQGQVATLIGANGAGKTTTLNAVCGLRPIQRGRIQLDGRSLADCRASDLPGLGLVQVPEGRRIFGRLTVRDNLELGAFCRRDGAAAVKADMDRALELFPRLRERFRQTAGTLSGGEQQMLAMARGLMARPKLLLLDEPSMGLAPRFVDQVFEAIRDINRRLGVTVLLVEQNAYLALEIADIAYVMEAGEIVLQGPGHELIDHEAVRRAYLG
jgi:branched-chain amino acid transport system ATP-binding protein